MFGSTEIIFLFLNGPFASPFRFMRVKSVSISPLLHFVNTNTNLTLTAKNRDKEYSSNRGIVDCSVLLACGYYVISFYPIFGPPPPV